jgi:uncharacterized protein
LGYAQWALLRDPPKDLIASVNLCSVFDHSLLAWTNGAFRLDRMAWAYAVAHQDKIADGNVLSILDPKKLRALLESMPLVEATRDFLAGSASYLLDFMSTPDVDSPLWTRSKHRKSLDLINVPLLMRSGWYDSLIHQTLEAYSHIRERGVKVYITIGPWAHAEACGSDAMPEVFDFLEEFVAVRKKDHRSISAKVFITGAEEWRIFPSWPPATRERVFYLDGDCSLAEQPPSNDSTPASFTFDPYTPTPTLGGPRLFLGGRVDDSLYASRSDVLIYNSSPLEEEVELMGKPIVQLAHSTDVPYADLWIRLSEVDADGVSHNLTENWQALDALEGRESGLTLPLVDRAHVFKKGTCIRLIIAGGSFPLLARNSGTGVNRTEAKELKAVQHTVQHAGGISKLILPHCS